MMRKEASRVVWDWQKDKGGGQHSKPSRMAAGIGLAVGGGVAAFLYAHNHPVMMVLVLAISLGIFSCALFFPRAYQVIQIGLQRFSFAVGQALTWLLLTPFFYLGFSLGRLMQKISKKDPMTRGWQPDCTSYWVDRPPVADKEQYKRQF